MARFKTCEVDVFGCRAWRHENSALLYGFVSVFRRLQSAHRGFPHKSNHTLGMDGRVQALPRVTAEIGDTWAYGVPSDPQKIRLYREMARLRASGIEDGSLDPTDPRIDGFSRNLLKIPGPCVAGGGWQQCGRAVG